MMLKTSLVLGFWSMCLLYLSPKKLIFCFSGTGAFVFFTSASKNLLKESCQYFRQTKICCISFFKKVAKKQKINFCVCEKNVYIYEIVYSTPRLWFRMFELNKVIIKTVLCCLVCFRFKNINTENWNSFSSVWGMCIHVVYYGDVCIKSLYI